MSWRSATLLAALGMAIGCVRLSQPAPQIHDYRLDYPPPAVPATPLPVVLRIAALTVAATYDREPIVYRDDAYSVDSSFYDRWATNPGNMLTDLLARDFADSGLYRAVQQRTAPAPADYQLNGHIEEIEQRATADGCAAHLRVRVTLLRLRDAGPQPVRLHSAFAADEPCACDDAHSLALGMSRALERLSSELQRTVYDTISADRD